MTERDFLALVASVRGMPAGRLMDVPLEDAPFDSLDLLMLRSALEVELDRDLTDERFLGSSTLRDLYELVSQS